MENNMRKKMIKKDISSEVDVEEATQQEKTNGEKEEKECVTPAC